jgi:hypothetical protein
VPLDLRDGVTGEQREVGAPVALDPFGTGTQCQQRVHRVRRDEAKRGAARSAERLEELLLDLVGAVGRPGVGAGQPVPKVGGEVLAQRYGVPVRVPVEVTQLGVQRLAMASTTASGTG